MLNKFYNPSNSFDQYISTYFDTYGKTVKTLFERLLNRILKTFGTHISSLDSKLTLIGIILTEHFLWNIETMRKDVIRSLQYNNWLVKIYCWINTLVYFKVVLIMSTESFSEDLSTNLLKSILNCFHVQCYLRIWKNS